MNFIFDNLDYESFVKAMDGVSARRIANCFNNKDKLAKKRTTKNSNKKSNQKATDFVLQVLGNQSLSSKDVEAQVKEQFDYKNIILIRKALKDLLASGKLKIVNNKFQIVKKRTVKKSSETTPMPSSKSKSTSSKTNSKKSSDRKSKKTDTPSKPASKTPIRKSKRLQNKK